MNIPKPLIAMANVIMVMTRTEIEGKPARRTSTTTEVMGLDPKRKNIITRELFRWNQKGDKFVFSGNSVILERHMKKLDITEEDIRHELHCRKIVLEWMVRKGIRRYTDVANVIREYYVNPNRVFQKARVGLK
jgi:flagellar protein FlaI